MKRNTIILLLTTFFAGIVFGQDTIYIYQKTNSILKYPINEVDSVSLKKNPIFSADTFRIYLKSSIIMKYAVLDVDSVTFGGNTSNPTIDGYTYPIVKIGTQIWFAENLRTSKYSDGTDIPLLSYGPWIGSYHTNAPGMCWYQDDQKTYSANKYGALYNWYAVSPTTNGNKNVCPSGWHIPSYNEWTTLIDYLGGERVAGGKLKEVGLSNWISPNGNATNETGFTALPAGYRYDDGTYLSIGASGFWWSSDQGSQYNAYYVYTYFAFGIIYRAGNTKMNGLSVRCLKD